MAGKFRDAYDIIDSLNFFYFFLFFVIFVTVSVLVHGREMKECL